MGKTKEEWDCIEHALSQMQGAFQRATGDLFVMGHEVDREAEVVHLHFHYDVVSGTFSSHADRSIRGDSPLTALKDVFDAVYSNLI